MAFSNTIPQKCARFKIVSIGFVKLFLNYFNHSIEQFDVFTNQWVLFSFLEKRQENTVLGFVHLFFSKMLKKQT